MNWKEQLEKLEKEEAFDIAISFMQMVISKDPNDRDAYLSIIYLIADTLVEPHSWDFYADNNQAKCDYYQSKYDEYSLLGEKYFARSYFKFMNDAAYLFVAAHAFITLPWIFGVDMHFRDAMLHKAYTLEPNNPIYQGVYYKEMYSRDPNNAELIAWAQRIVGSDSPLNQFANKGRVWIYAKSIARYFPNKILKIDDFC